MADQDLSVRFGGDTIALNASIAQARATLAAFAPGTTATAKTSLDAFTASMGQSRQANENWSASMRDIAVAAAAATYTVKELAAGYEYLFEKTLQAEGATIRFASGASSTALKATTSAVDAASSSLTGYYTSAAYAQRGAAMFTVANEGIQASIGRVIISTREYLDITGRISRSITDSFNAFRLYESGLDQTQLSAIAAAGGLNNLEAALSRASQPQLPYLVDITARLEKIPGVTDAAATSIISMFSTIPDYSTEATDILVQFLETFAKTGDQAQAIAKQITDAFKDQKNGGQVLGDIVNGVENIQAQLKLAGIFAQRLVPEQAVAMYDRIQGKLKDSQTLIQAQDADHKRVLSTLILQNGEEQGAADIIKDQLATDEKRLDAIARQNVLIEVQRQGYVALTDEAKKQLEFREALDGLKTTTSTGNDLGEKKDKLNSVSRKDPDRDQSTSALKALSDEDVAIRTAVLEAGKETDDGVLAVLSTMQNRVNAKYGDYGDSLGEVVKKKRAYSAVDDDQGNFDPSKLAAVDPTGYQYQRVARIRAQMTGDDAPDDPTGGATHYYAPSLAHPNWARGMGNQSTHGTQVFGNPDGSPVLSDDDERTRRQGIAQINTQDRANDAASEGGTEEEQHALEIAKQGLATSRDQVKEAEELLDIRKRAADAAKDGTTAEQREKNKGAADAQNALTEAQAAQDKAANALRAAQARQGSKERLDIEVGELDAEIKAAGENVTKVNELQKEKLEVVKRYTDEQKQITDAANAAATANTLTALKSQEDTIRERGRVGLISHAEETADLQANLTKQNAAERAAFEQRKALFGEGTTEYRKANEQLAELDQKTNLQRTKNAESANAAIYASYKGEFEKVGSTISSSLMSILEGTGNFKQLMANVAKNITQSFLDAGVKMAVDWAAKETFATAQTVLGEGQRTLAVVTGQAARTTAVGTGAAAQQAVTATSIIGSIQASAAETFAGIFGFLSPILGPAAAGPAAAGQATVAAVASALPSFDVGAWSLPSNMVAQVHAGEMIVPAGPAAMMRAAAGGGGADGGGSGFNPTINYHSHGDRPKAQILSEIDTIVGGLKQAHRNGAFLNPRK